MVIDIQKVLKDKSLIDKDITVAGWIKTSRVSKNFGFIELNDGSSFKSLQIVVESDLENFEEVSKYTISSSIEVTGTVVESPGAKQSVEIHAKEIKLIGLSDRDYPLQKKRHTMEYLRTKTHLRPRTNTFKAVFKVRSLIAYAIHKFFQENGFVYVHSPIITASDAEGAGEMFQVTTLDLQNVPMVDGKVDYNEDFFGRETHLTVSGQLEVEAFAHAFKDCYTFGPTFRAENSNTARHAAEFWMIEPELSFCKLDGMLENVEECIKYVISYVLENAPDEMEFFNQFIDKGLLERLNSIVEKDFGKVTYTEAVEILKNSKKEFKYLVEWGIDLQTEHERYLTEEVFNKPVFVTDYPKEIKAFYMTQNDDGKTVRASDLLVPGIGELVGGSQREHRVDVLENRMKELGLDTSAYEWYLDLRRFGTVITSGYGIGFERLVMYITGMKNIRDVIPFPRTVNTADI